MLNTWFAYSLSMHSTCLARALNTVGGVGLGGQLLQVGGLPAPDLEDGRARIGGLSTCLAGSERGWCGNRSVFVTAEGNSGVCSRVNKWCGFDLEWEGRCGKAERIIGTTVMFVGRTKNGKSR